MALTYLSGERIQGSSTAAVTPTFSDDFSSYGSQSAADTAWVSDDTAEARVNISTDKIALTILPAAATISHDLGAGNVSDTAWVLRFTFNVVAKQTQSYAFIGLSDNTSNYGTSQDLIDFLYRYSTGSKRFEAHDVDGSAPNSTGNDDNESLDPSTGTDYHMEIVRESATSYKVRRYTNSTYGTVADTYNGTCVSTTQSLRYIKIGATPDSSVGITSSVTFDDIKFYNGITSASTTDEKTTISNVPAGTRYEETDTLKIFTRTGGAGAGWAEKGSSFADRLRGCFAGGYVSSSSNTIDYVVIATLGNAADFGNLTRSNSDLSGCSNDTRGLWCCGGNSTTDTIDYITIATLGNATDFGNASASKSGVAALADATRACVAGGNTGSKIDVIDYFTIASPGNATDFGNLTEAREKPAGVADATRGCIGGGKNAAGSRVNTIDYITIQSTGNATDFGDLTQIREELGSCADATRACWAGGAASVYDIIDYVTIQTTGNATDFGNLLSATEILAGCADATRGIFGGGRVSGSNTNVIAYITIQSVGNATDFGDLTEARRGIASGVAA